MIDPILVFGAKGQVGLELMALAAERHADPVGLTRGDVDIRDKTAVEDAIVRHTPRLIVNAAAYTAVDRAESEPDLARAINCDAAGIIARAAASRDVPFIHLSTDYVFDGTKLGAYDEDDPIAPLGVYGRTKAEGEDAVRDAGGCHVILRTAWIYSPYRANFLKTMMRLAIEKDRMRVVADQRGCPTATIDIAEAILAVDRSLRSDRLSTGTFHFAGLGTTTWHAFAQAIVAAQARTTGKQPPVDPIPTADYPTPAKRPANSELASDRFVASFGYRAEPWQVRVDEIVAQLV